MGEHEDVETAEVSEGVWETVQSIVREIQSFQLLTHPLDVSWETWGRGRGEEKVDTSYINVALCKKKRFLRV